MFCTKCGSALAEGNRFCGACGAPVVAAPASMAAAAQAALPTPTSSAPTRVLPAPAPTPTPAPAAAAAPAATPASGARPGGVTLLAAWQFVNAFVLGASTLSMVSFLMSGPGFRLRPEVAAVFGVLALVVFAALASGVGLLQQRSYGRTLLLPFAWFSLLLFPLGTVLAFFVLRYAYKPQIKARFEPRAGASGWPAWVGAGFALVVIGAGAATGMVAMRKPGEVADAAAAGPQVEQLATHVLQIGILEDGGDRIVPSNDNLSAKDVEYAASSVDEFGRTQITLQFTPDGAAKMERLTTPNIGKQMGFLIDGRLDLAQAARISSVISNNAQINIPDTVEAQKFVQAMEADRVH